MEKRMANFDSKYKHVFSQKQIQNYPDHHPERQNMIIKLEDAKYALNDMLKEVGHYTEKKLF